VVLVAQNFCRKINPLGRVPALHLDVGTPIGFFAAGAQPGIPAAGLVVAVFSGWCRKWRAGPNKTANSYLIEIAI
jgi:hypothetical protein